MIGESVTRRRRVAGGVDRNGDPIAESYVDEAVPGAAVADGSFAEPAEAGREAVVADLTLYWLRRDVDGAATDRWVVRGVEFEAIGPPFYWVNPWTGELFGTVVRLRSVAG